MKRPGCSTSTKRADNTHKNFSETVTNAVTDNDSISSEPPLHQGHPESRHRAPADDFYCTLKQTCVQLKQKELQSE